LNYAQKWLQLKTHQVKKFNLSINHNRLLVSNYQFLINILSKHLDNFKINFTQTLKKGLEDRTCDLLKLQEVEMAAFLDPRYCYKFGNNLTLIMNNNMYFILGHLFTVQKDGV
jgi:hypothetical protein